MSEQSKNEDYISLIESENEKHLFFSGSLNRLSAFNLNGQLVACDMAYREKKTENEFGFIQKDEQKEVNDKLIIHLNCPGGQVSYAFLIADVIKSLEIPVYCIGEGSIASAGTVLLLACEKRTALPHCTFYFHETIHSIEQLSFDELGSFMEESKRVNEELKNYYRIRSNISIADIDTLMRSEAIISALEAYNKGFLTDLPGTILV